MNILKRLHERINHSNVFNYKLSIPDFMHFILADEFQDNTFSDAYMYELYEKKKYLSQTKLTKYLSIKTWDFERLKQSHPQGTVEKYSKEKCLSILKENCITLLPPQYRDHSVDFSSVIQTIVSLHFFATPMLDSVFKSNLPNICDSYVPWTEMESHLAHSLERNHILFSIGNPGSGKKQLILYVLNNLYLSGSFNSYWLNINNSISIEDGLTQISFIGNEKTSYNTEKIIDILKEKSHNDVLIIHKSSLTNEDFSFIETTLSSMRLRIIVVTYCKVIPSDYPILDIDQRPLYNLIQIFRKYNPNSTFSDKDIQKLLKNISNNVYVLTLIAKATIKENRVLTKEALLNNFESLYYKPQMPALHTNYYEQENKSSQNLFTLIKRILSFYPISESNKQISEISIWAKIPIASNYLKKEFGEKIIAQCINSGILQFYDDDHIYMPALIADTFWAEYQIDYEEYKKKILQFLHSMECAKPLAVPYETLYPIISNLIFRFHFQITIMPSRTNKKSLDLFLNWNNLLTNIMEHYMHLGNYIYAQKILPHLYIAYNKRGKILDCPSSLFSSQVKELLRLQADYMQSSDIIASFDNLINRINTIKNNVTSLNKSSRSIINRLILSILQDLADTSVEIAIQYTRDYFLSYNVASNTQWNNCLYAIYNFADKFKIMGKNEEYYYKGIYYTLITLYRNPDTLQKAKDNFRIFLFLETDVELRFKVKCIQFYFYILSATSFTPIPYSTLIQNFENLYIEFTNKIWSYHTSYIFYSCVSVLSFILPYCISDRLQNTLITCMKQCKKFYEKQLSLPSAQKETFINLLNEKISEMSS